MDMQQDRRSWRQRFRDAVTPGGEYLGFARGQARNNELHILESSKWTRLSFYRKEWSRLQPFDRMFSTDNDNVKYVTDEYPGDYVNDRGDNYYCREHDIEFSRFNDFDKHNQLHHPIEPDDEFKRRLHDSIERNRDERLADN